MCHNWEKLKPIWRGSPSTACIENSVSYVSMDDEVDPFNEYRQEQYQEEEEGEMSDGVCSEAVVTTENDVSSEVSLYRQKHTVTKNVNATPKFVDNKRKNMEKGLSASQRDKIYMKMAKDELILKQTLVNQLTVATAESNKAFDKMSASIESVGKSIGEGIKLVQWVIIKEALALLILLLTHIVIIIRSNTLYPVVQHILMDTTHMYHLLELIQH